MLRLQYSRLKSMNFLYPEVFPKGAVFLRQIDAVNIVIFMSVVSRRTAVNCGHT